MRARPAILGVLLLAACGPGERPPPHGPSVLLITLDTTRADRLGAYGYPLAETPTWDRLAAEGTVFRRAYAAAPLTLPSHASILAGLNPPSHGVRDDGAFVLDDGIVTLAERFRDAGWTTAAFTAAFPTRRRWGLDQGFAVYRDPTERPPTHLDRRDQRRADEVVDDALAVLPRLGERPAFVWVHLYDAHWPYDPPEPWASRHEGRPYDGELAFVDAQAARLIAWWEAAHPDGIVLVTADHGEALGDGGEQTHGFLLHDGTIRVPLLVKGPGVEAGAVVDDPVGHVDIAPTLLRLAGLPLHDGLEGRDLREGGSDAPYSEALTGRYNLGLAPLSAYTDADGRYAEGAFGAWYPALGDVVLTAPEPPPARGGPELVAQRETLARLRAEMDEVVAPSATLDAASLELLTALGYAGGDPGAVAGEVDPRDMVDVFPLGWQARQLVAMGLYGQAEDLVERLEGRAPGTFGPALLRAQLQRRRGRLDEAAETWRTLYLDAPSSTVAMQLAGLGLLAGDPLETERWCREALGLAPSAEALGCLARSLRAQGRTPEADEVTARLVVDHPDHPVTALVHAEQLLAWDQAASALGEARAALRVLPHVPWAHEVAGRALWGLGRPDEAIERLQETLRLAPYDLGARSRLALWQLELGHNAEAVRLVAPVARLRADDPAVSRLYHLARAALANEWRGEPITPIPPELAAHLD